MLPNITKIEYLFRPLVVYPVLRGLFAVLARLQWIFFHSLPPPLPVKAALIQSKAKAGNIRVFVETGTFFGDMIVVLLPTFDRMISIELDVLLSQKARNRFANIEKVKIINGDSGKMLSEVLSTLEEPALFWLDGHFSGGVTARADSDTPIVEELESIFSARPLNHVILIDDARLFGVHPDYPSIDYLSEVLKKCRPGWELTLQNDVICIQSATAA